MTGPERAPAHALWVPVSRKLPVVGFSQATSDRSHPESVSACTPCSARPSWGAQGSSRPRCVPHAGYHRSHRSTDGAKCTARGRALGRGAEPAVSQVRCHSCLSLGDVGHPEQILILLFSCTPVSLSLNASATGVGRCW